MAFENDVIYLSLLTNFSRFYLYRFMSYLGHSASSINSSQSIQSVDQKMTLVFFIGGCTYAEVSAFRYLSESHEGLKTCFYRLIFEFLLNFEKKNLTEF